MISALAASTRQARGHHRDRRGWQRDRGGVYDRDETQVALHELCGREAGAGDGLGQLGMASAEA